MRDDRDRGAPRAPSEFDVWFDYTCPFTHRAHRWLDHVEASARWRPFSLLEHNYRGDGPPVWRLPERADDISLLLFAGHELVRDEGGDLDRYRHAAFEAWHESDRRLGIGDIVTFAIDAGATGREQAVREHFLDAESEHDAARTLGVFGSPTLVFGPDRAVFVRLDDVPEPDSAQEVLDSVATTSALPSVAELKRPRAPVRPGARHLQVQGQ